MTYRAPLDDIRHTLDSAAGLSGLLADGTFADLDAETVASVLEGAAQFAELELAPLDQTGDKNPSRLEGSTVITPPGWADAYKSFVAGGWSSLSGPEVFGGQALPHVIASSAIEIWCGANLAFGLCPLLTQGAVDALSAAGSAELKKRYLPKMVSGEWTGTMNLTEPHAGTDLGALKTKAEGCNSAPGTADAPATSHTKPRSHDHDAAKTHQVPQGLQGPHQGNVQGWNGPELR